MHWKVSLCECNSLRSVVVFSIFPFLIHASIVAKLFLSERQPTFRDVTVVSPLVGSQVYLFLRLGCLTFVVLFCNGCWLVCCYCSLFFREGGDSLANARCNGVKKHWSCLEKLGTDASFKPVLNTTCSTAQRHLTRLAWISSDYFESLLLQVIGWNPGYLHDVETG